MSKLKFQTPTGMHDILPEEQKYFKKVYSVVENIAIFYGFKKITTPILEQYELFEKGTGLTTDVVQKEMFKLRTKGNDVLALRPEGTPSVARAYIQHGMTKLPQPVKLWYSGPFFRYERPQAGRYRQFNQFGFEVLGERKAIIDAQIIQIFYNILKELKFKNLTVEINSMGDSKCRPYYRKLLVSYLKTRVNLLCPNCQKRFKENPLRILDCKEEKCQKVIENAPQMIDRLCDECKTHFKQVLEFLDEIDIPYILNPYLARGLDYYTKTVFEIYEDTPEGRKQGALSGGGRYDNLLKLIGGRETFACGGSCGVERIINLMKEDKKIYFPQSPVPKIFLAQLGNVAKKRALALIEEFRKVKIPIFESLSNDSLSSQLRIANKIGVDYALILGQKEVIEKVIILREMKTGKQSEIKMDKIARVVAKKIKKK
ncbi:MAG: histidine--tRNA ligase [Patescibacteria group bacterium]|nr:histidine--tRNA ligase [Patescibacteria group bacterium]